jgi:vitamin B12 transporter
MLLGTILGFPLIMFLLLAVTALGETKDGDDRTFEMEAVEVTAERIDEYVKNHPQEITVVRRAEILKRNLLTVEEALKTMPGVEVDQSAGVTSRISIRGSGKSGGVLVLLNGRPLNTNQYGGADLNTIPVDMIESITVFKPPVPVWLGPGATDGAINIVTRDLAAVETKGKDKPSTVTVEAGSFGLAQGSASHIVPIAGGNVLLTATGAHIDGKRTNSDRDDGNFSLYWNREEKNGRRYEVNGRYYLSEFGSPGPLDNPTRDARQRYEKGSLDMRLAGLIGGTDAYSVNPYVDVVTLRDRSQSGFTSNLEDIKVGIKSETTWSEKTGLWSFRISGILENDNLDHSIAGSHDRVMADLSGQYDRRFGSLTGTVGIRGNNTGDFGFNPGTTCGLGYALSKETLLRAKAGYAVNVPTFGQLYQTSHGSIDQVRGNPDLREEKVWSYDFGLEHAFGKERFFQVTLFRADTQNLIIYRRGADKIYRPVNIAVAERQGMESTLRYGWETGPAAELDVILQTSRNGDTGKDLPYTPRVKVKTTVQYTLARLKTRLESTVRYEDTRFSEAEDLMAQRLGPYAVVDMKAIQPFLVKGYAGEWFLKVENLFNTAYESHFGYPDEGIRFAAGFQVRF